MKYEINEVKVYDTQGLVMHSIQLPETVKPMPGKRTAMSDKGLFYKGAGIVYQNHLANTVEKGAIKIADSGIVYEKYVVMYRNLRGQHGIFNFPHQPMFDDLEGGCGTKEQRILDNQKKFELSAIKNIENVIDVGVGNSKIFVYSIRDAKASPMDTVKLLEYVLSNDYNTAWDKNTWADIYCYKYVRDIADWFESDEACHKLGTVYSILNSLYNADIYMYMQLVNHVIGNVNPNKLYVLYYSACIVNHFCEGKIEFVGEGYNEEVYAKILKLLFDGKACCHLGDDAQWNWVREYYYGKIDTYKANASKRI